MGRDHSVECPIHRSVAYGGFLGEEECPDCAPWVEAAKYEDPQRIIESLESFSFVFDWPEDALFVVALYRRIRDLEDMLRISEEHEEVAASQGYYERTEECADAGCMWCRECLKRGTVKNEE